MATTYTVTVNSEFGSTVSGKMYLTVPQSPITINLTNDTYRVSGTFQFSHDFNGVSSIKFYSDSDISIGMRKSNDRSWAGAIRWKPSTTTTLNKGTKLSFVNNVDLSTSSVFDSANKTSRYVTHYSDKLDVWWGTSGGYAGGYISNNALVINYVLDAPPTYTETILSSAPYYLNSNYRVRLNNVVAQFGGDVISKVLTIGNQTINIGDSNTGSITLLETGTFTPVLTVIDSRGQVTTHTLESIVVTQRPFPSITPINSNVVNGNIEIDMLVDCVGSNVLNGIRPSNMLLYTNDGTPITFPYSPPQCTMRCKGVVPIVRGELPNVIPVAIANETGVYSYVNVNAPSTATPSIMKQNGETTPISPRIDVSNIRFNPQTTDLSYTVGEILGVRTTNMTKAQTNVDGDVKHIVTHADNVKVNDTTTLQDWITEQYNYLIT